MFLYQTVYIKHIACHIHPRTHSNTHFRPTYMSHPPLLPFKAMGGRGALVIILSGVWCSTYSRLAALFSLSLLLSFPYGGTPTNIPHHSHPLLQLPEDDWGTRSLFLSSLSTSLGQAQLPAERANGDHHGHIFHLILAK